MLMQGIAPISSIKLPKGSTVLMRVDFNVNIRKGKIEDDFRIVQTLPTIKYLLKRGYRLLLLTHAQKDKNTPSLRSLASALGKYPVFRSLRFISGTNQKHIRQQLKGSGHLFLLENSRLFKGELTNSVSTAKFFASLGEVFVNDAFAVAHRKHASVHRITNYLPSYNGLLFADEFRNLSGLFRSARPLLMILGGKKVSTKLPMLNTFFKKTDNIFIGGSAANTFFVGRGLEVGRSVVEKRALRLIDKHVLSSPNILLPVDVVVRRGRKKLTVAQDAVQKRDEIFDAGPKTIAQLKTVIKKSKTIFWNGPLGFMEEGFIEGTAALVRALHSTNARTIVGGGDTITFLHKQKLLHRFDFVSTGGGAMLDFLANGTLPAIEALKKNKKKFKI